MTRNSHKKPREKKQLSKYILTGIGVIIVIFACIFAIKTKPVQDALERTFGDNVKYQKEEYTRQRALAAKKYGSSSSSSTVAKEANKETKDTKKRSKTNYINYTVKPGDFLSTIASEYGTTTQELIDLNQLDSSSVDAGQVIKVPANKKVTSSNEATSTSTVSETKTSASQNTSNTNSSKTDYSETTTSTATSSPANTNTANASSPTDNSQSDADDTTNGAY